MSDRLAPKQVDRPLEDEDQGHGDYNIWYHARAGKRKRTGFHERGVAARTKCVPSRHEGRTKAGSGSDLCVHFARGCCAAGHRCTRKHRVPAYADDGYAGAYEDLQHDCFGRKRETEGDDQNGVGSVLKENNTLFVGDFGGGCTEDTLRSEFSAFGPIVQIRFYPAKSLGFIQYRWRASAEFAKEAMANQVVGGAVVGVKWAKEDPNPRRVAEMVAARRARIVRAVQDAEPQATAEEEAQSGPAPASYQPQFDQVAHFLRQAQQAQPAQQAQQAQPGGGRGSPEGQARGGGRAQAWGGQAAQDGGGGGDDGDVDTYYPDTEAQYGQGAGVGVPVGSAGPRWATAAGATGPTTTMAATAAAAAAPSLAPGWTQLADERTGHSYFLFAPTGHTQWEPPPHPPPPPPPVEEAGPSKAVEKDPSDATSLSLLAAYSSDDGGSDDEDPDEK